MIKLIHNTVISFAIALSFVVSVSSCGIDTLSYLDYEPRNISDTISALNFKGPSVMDSEFSGIYIYYRIYAYKGSATTDYSYIISKQGDEDAVPGSGITSYLTTSSGLGYKEIVLDGSLTIPTLKKGSIDSDELISIIFTGSAEPYLSIEGDSTNHVLSRKVTGSGGKYLSFYEDEPQSGDADYESYSSDDDDDYYVQFFAASYGYDSSLNDVYSDAVYLGLITLNY